MGMSRKRMRHLLLEVSRRLHFEQHKTYEGFGKTAKFYGENWRPVYEEIQKLGGYKAAWNNDVVKQLRNSVGM